MATTSARILCIEDDHIVLDVLRAILEDENYQVLKADTAAEGVRLAREETPDLILLDILLPDINGFDVCRQLKSSKQTQDIPVIFLTGLNEIENELLGFSEGAVDFLAKPIQTGQLCARVKNALEIKFVREQLEQQAIELKTMNAALKGVLAVKEQTVNKLGERDAILNSVNYVATSFLQNENWQDVIEDVLKHLGENVQCDHVYCIVLDSLVDRKQQYDWYRTDSIITDSSLELLAAWRNPKILLANGKPVVAPDATHPSSVRAEFRRNNIHSCLILPVYVYQTLWGCLGFDCSRSDRHWNESLVNAMETASDIIGSALQCSHACRERVMLATAIQQFSDCVLMTGENGRIFYANQACKKVTGYNPEEMIGIELQFMQIDALERIDCGRILDIARQGEGWQGQMRNSHKDGSLYDEAINVIPIRDEQDRITSFVIIKRDETEKNRLESIAEAANLMDNVGFVFSGIRHELGNPLNSLKMTVSVLRRQVDTFSPEKIIEFLDRSLNEIKRMEYLLYSLKNFNIYEEQQLAPVDLAVFLENFIRLHEEDLHKKGIRVQCTIVDKGCGLIDERAMHQVMLNLMTNSVNALEGRKEPAITLYLVKKQKDFIEIRFEDNGCGFPESANSEVFKPFFTTYAKGTGLGLTIVRKMLISMNCTISIEGREGIGTIINIMIPEYEGE